jgi:nucleoside-diphosphate-sugar epimerase
MTLLTTTLTTRPRILIIGCGDVGLRLLPILVKTHKVYVLTTQESKKSYLKSLGASPILGNLDDSKSLTRIAHLAPHVIHLAPPNQDGRQDLRTKNLIQALSKGTKTQKLVYVSTSGVYGDCKGDYVDETRLLAPTNPRAYRRMDAEAQLRAWGVQQNVQVTILRVPGIYASNRLPIERLKNGTPVLTSEEDVFTNHIHADDLARVILYAYYRGLPQRVLNVSDSSWLKMGDYFDLVAKAFDLPTPQRVTFEELRSRVTPQMLSFMKESRRLQNHRLGELGFKLQYETVDAFLKTQKDQQGSLF